MAHADQGRFFELLVRHFCGQLAGEVIDIGSLDINGGIRQIVPARSYLGVDLAEGPNVHLVARGEQVAFPDQSFDAALSSECFEHNPQWRATLLNMIRMTKPGGLVAFSCATRGRSEHGTSRSDSGYAAPLAVKQGQEHYKNVTPSEVRKVLRNQTVLQHWRLVVNKRHADLLFWGVVGPVPANIEKHLSESAEEITRELGGPRNLHQISRQLLVVALGRPGIALAHRVRRRLTL